LLFQASRIPAAPTAQRFASAAPRFPYIEATGARVNLKLDQLKTPFSLSEAEFALWEPEHNQWRLRLVATPIRSNTAPGETGTLRMEATLGSANQAVPSLIATPIDIHGDWKDAQLGGLTQFVTGSDANVRGDLSASFAIQGTLQENKITAHVALLNARRADFIPPDPLKLEAGCEAHASQTFHAFTGITCYWPPAESDSRSELILAAEIPDVRSPQTGSFRITLPGLPASTFFNWVSVATPHPPVGLAGPGVLSGQLMWGTPSDALPISGVPAAGAPRPGWSGELEFSGGAIAIADQPPIPLGDVVLQASRTTAPESGRRRRSRPPPPPPDHDGFDLLPVALDLGGKTPATLTGHLDDTGYVLHLSGDILSSRLLAVGKAVPQLGDGLGACLPADPVRPAAPAALPTAITRRGSAVETAASSESSEPATEGSIDIDLSAHRSWGGPQAWCPLQAAAAPTAPGSGK
jgi:hypothetical protein